MSANTLHEWQRSGVLVENLKATYMKIPEHQRGGYFPWFLENGHELFPLVPKTEATSFERQMVSRVVQLGDRYSGHDALSRSLVDGVEQEVHLLCGMALENAERFDRLKRQLCSNHPCPDMSICMGHVWLLCVSR